MRSFLLCIPFFCAQVFLSPIFAQTNFQDVVYLKNGSIIRGIIIEQVPNETIKIQTQDKSVYVFRFDEISSITKEEIPAERQSREILTKDNIKKRGYINITELSIGEDLKNDDFDYAGFDRLPSIGIQTINGYQFNPHVSLGVGIGIHAYHNYLTLPVFADLRFNIVPHPVSFFITISGGYAFSEMQILHKDYYNNFTGGIFLNPGFGIKFNVSKTKALTFSLNYRYQEITEQDAYSSSYPYYHWINYYKEVRLRYLLLKMGFMF